MLSMGDWWEYLLKDGFALVADLTSKDLQYPFGLILWIVLLFLPLNGVDYRDHVVGMSYALFCTSAAIVFFLAAPGIYTDINDFGIHVALVCFFGGIASYRWFHRNDILIVVSSNKATKNKKQDINHEKI